MFEKLKDQMAVNEIKNDESQFDRNAIEQQVLFNNYTQNIQKSFIGR